MESPRKLCPKCQTSAPMEAGFCGTCGHQYRTRFTPNQAPPAPALPFLETKKEGNRGLLIAVAALAALASFGFVLWLGMRPKLDKPAESVPVRVQAPPSRTEPASETHSSATLDPVEAEARRALERAKRNIDIPLADTAPKDTEGRIHLRGGGAVGKDEWEAARKAVQNSPVLK